MTSKAYSRPTIATEEVLSCYQCKQETSVTTADHNATATTNSKAQPYYLDNLVHSSGWKFSSHHDKILNESGLASLTKDIKRALVEKLPSLKKNEADTWINDDNLNINDSKLHLPPMLFGKDVFQMRIGTGTLSINARDALLCWAAQHSVEATQKNPLDVVKVPYAAKWAARMTGTFGLDGKPSAAAPIGAASCETAVLSAAPASDWTFSSDYVCTLHADSTAGVVLQARSLPGEHTAGASDGVPVEGFRSVEPVAGDKEKAGADAEGDVVQARASPWTIQCSPGSGIEYELLKRQDEPILFYDEFLFYQDDLEDCGEVVFEGKVRVMPSCWFVLCKQFLRVDGVLVRCRETRLFHKFPPVAAVNGGAESSVATAEARSTEIHMEVCWREHRLPLPPTTVPAPTSAPAAEGGAVAGAGGAATSGSVAASSVACVRPPASAVAYAVRPAAPAGNSAPASAYYSASASASTGAGPAQQLPSAVLSTAATHPLFSSQGRNLAHTLPLTNQQEGIHQFYTLRFTEMA